MNCCQCQGIEEVFSQKYVAKEMAEYRARGPHKTTRMLTNALKAGGVEGQTLLDIGGGVGAIQHDLLKAGVEQVTSVDASSAYLAAAQDEARRRGYTDRVSYRHGNFVDLAAGIAPADIVTLDRVICCYHDMERLVDLSAARAGQQYGLVYPRDGWLIWVGAALLNFIYRLQKNPFRTFAHSSRAVEAVLSRHGFRRKFYRQTLFWQVVVFVKS